MKATEEDRQLWELLGSARQPQAPGHLADDILRRIRLEAGDDLTTVSFSDWLARSWKGLTSITGATAMLASMLAWQTFPTETASLEQNDLPEISALIASIPSSDLDHFDNLDTALNDNELWLGTAFY